MANKCIFCEIVNGKDDKTDVLYSDDTVVVFRDIRPATDQHYLVAAKQHIPDAKQLKNEHIQLVEHMVAVGKQIVEDKGGKTNDLRLGFHWPPFHAISHLHLHVISSTNQMAWMARAIFRPNSFWFVTDEWLIERLKKMAPTDG